MNSNSSIPPGCPSSLGTIYFPLCDLQALWGVVVEAFASAGVVTCFVLLIVMLSSLPFVVDRNRKGMMSLQVSFLIFSLGLFSVSFVFIIEPNSITCVIRCFCFGVLFAGCFACLLMHGLWLVLLDRDQNPRGWLLRLGAMALWLVEVIINIEWIVLTQMAQSICNITNKDFTMALTYVMVLLVAVVLMAVPSMTYKHKLFRRDGLYILLTGVLSICIWLAWAVMYIHGNHALNRNDWDDATLAIAVVSNGWVFLMVYSIPEICAISKHMDSDDENPESERYSSESQIYENIYRDQIHNQQDMGRVNKAFSKDNPQPAKNVVSPYSGYSGQQRGRVYQPTELALITSSREVSHDAAEFRAPPLTAGGNFLPKDR